MSDKYQKEYDLVFQNIEEKRLIADQARYKHRLQYHAKHFSRFARPYLDLIRDEPESVRNAGLLQITQRIIEAADRDFDSEPS